MLAERPVGIERLLAERPVGLEMLAARLPGLEMLLVERPAGRRRVSTCWPGGICKLPLGVFKTTWTTFAGTFSMSFFAGSRKLPPSVRFVVELVRGDDILGLGSGASGSKAGMETETPRGIWPDDFDGESV